VYITLQGRGLACIAGRKYMGYIFIPQSPAMRLYLTLVLLRCCQHKRDG
jgi:hypothetical protein